MPMQVSWNEQHPCVLLWEVGVSFTLDEYFMTLDRVRELVAERNPEQYYIVTDLKQTKHFPKGLLNGMRTGHRRASDAYKGTVMIGAPIFARQFINMMQQFSVGENKYTFTNTLDEALAFVSKQIPSDNVIQ